MQSITNSEKNEYLEKINSGKEARQYVRIQVIGKEGVGKSSLVHRLLGKQIEGIKSTDGIEIFKSIQIRKDDGKWIVDEGKLELPTYKGNFCCILSDNSSHYNIY